GLEDFAKQRGVRELPVHQLADVAEAHVAAPELGVGEDAAPALPDRIVALEGEVHLVDAVALGGGAERRLGTRRTAAEQDAVLAPHAGATLTRVHPGCNPGWGWTASVA